MIEQQTVEQKGPLVRVIKIVTGPEKDQHVSYISAPYEFYPNQKAVDTKFAERSYRKATLMEMGLETLKALICPTCDKMGKKMENKKDKIGEFDPFSAEHPIFVTKPAAG